MLTNRNYILVAFFILILIIIPAGLYAQVSSGEVPLSEALQKIGKRERIKFFFKAEWIKDVTVPETSVNGALNSFLLSLYENNGIGNLPYFDGKYIILFKGSPPSSTLSGIKGNESGQGPEIETDRNSTYTLSGVVRDATTNEAIVGATVLVEETTKGTVTNYDGYFEVKLAAGMYRIRVTAVSKLPTILSINLNEDQRHDFEIYEQNTQLDDILVTSQSADRNISSTEMSQIKMDIKTMKTIPQFMGEIDVVRSILMLPGVSTVGEGASGFNVRGGNVDQNLILLDETPLFNSSHLFGFFSTFNPDFVKDVTLLKGGMPANYGGRISSVLDVKTKDGNPNKVSVNGGVGIITSRLLVEGPISKKTTFIIGGRYAYPDWLLKRVPDLNVQKSSSNFYDANLRIRHQFNDKNNLIFSAYRSQDQFKFAADTTYSWSTTNFSLKYNTTISEKLFASATAIYSKFNNDITGTTKGKEFEANFGIDTRGGKVDLTYIPNSRHKIDFGASLTSYVFNPGKLTPGINSSNNPIILNDEYSTEMGYYISDEFRLSNKISFHMGLRYSEYYVRGKADVAIYDPTAPQSPSTVIGSTHYDDGQLIKKYSGLEPRFSSKFTLSPESSVKISYNRNLQYIQLISNTTAVSPLDLWRTSNYYIKPQTGDQVALGYFRNFDKNRYEISIEGYYKWIQNLVEYKNGADLFMNPLLESQLLNAKGEAYGVELLIRKKEGRLTGWLAYTYARSFRLVKGNTPEETINQGNKYPSNFDKPNDLAIVANYSLTKRMSFSANFTYSTGRPITYPRAVYSIDGYIVSQYSERNQARIPDYHRLDISFTIDESLRKAKKWKGSWTFSIYNVYGRANAYSVFFKPQYNGSQTQSYKLAVVGTMFPSITYNFKF